MNIYITYEAIDNEQHKESVKEFLIKVPNAHLLPLLHLPNKPTFKQRILRKLKTAFRKEALHDEIEDLARYWKSTVTPSNKNWSEHLSTICLKNIFDIIQVEMPWKISDIFSLPTDAKRIYVHHELGFVRRALESQRFNNSYLDAVRKYVDNNEIANYYRYYNRTM